MNVISYDRLGWGESDMGPAELTPREEMGHLNRLLSQLGLGNRLVLVGHSYGGMLIKLYSLMYPESVEGMLLIDPMNRRFVDRLGIDRLRATVPDFDNPQTRMELALTRMKRQLPIILEDVKSSELKQDIPVVLVSVGNPPYDFGAEAVAAWRTSHEEIVSFSSLHEIAVFPDNSHDVVQEAPAAIIEQLVHVLDQIDDD